MSRQCGVCEGRASTGGVICWPCANRLRDGLIGGDAGRAWSTSGLKWLIPRLEECAYGQSQLGGGGKRGKGDAYPMELNLRAADLLRDIDVALSGWVRDLEPGSTPMGRSRSAATYLGYQLDQVLALPHVPAIYKAVERFNAAGLKLINREPSVYCGPCSGTLETGEPCGYELSAEEDARAVECRRCGAVHDVDEIRARLLGRVDSEPQPAANIHRILGWVGRPVPRREFHAVVATLTPRMYLQSTGERNLRRLPDSVALYAYGDVVAALDNPAQDSDSGAHHRRRRRPVRGGI